MPGKLGAVTKRPDKVLVAHYYNPPYLLPLVEIVRSPETSEESVQTIQALLKNMGKSPVIVQKEAPGYIGNRLQLALLREALSIVQRGIASPEDVDTVVKSSFGRRLSAAGVFEIFDIVGWDSVTAAWPYLVPDLNASPECPPSLKEKVARGEIGVKAGKGIYTWTPESAEELKRRIAKALIEISRRSSWS
jgi:3-hydroxybutyryl-CoA dehydrogenase